jgi:hypothetical protein
MPLDYKCAPHLVYGAPTPTYVIDAYRRAEATDDMWDWRRANIEYWTLVERVEACGQGGWWEWRLEAARRVDAEYEGAWS